jgi:hypothetical protein
MIIITDLFVAAYLIFKKVLSETHDSVAASFGFHYSQGLSLQKQTCQYDPMMEETPGVTRK